MHSLTPEELSPRASYRLLTSLVIPRPIAWVSTVDDEGVFNLAPFSFFNAVGAPPPTVMISVDQRNGKPKDTLLNIRANNEFVLNFVDASLLTPMNATSGEWEHDVDEFSLAQLTPTPSQDIRPPRILEAVAAMEVIAKQIVPVEDTTSTMVIGRVIRFHIREDIFREDGAIDPLKLRPLGRLGGDNYGTLGEVIQLARPKIG
ncbi:MAG: flavin reductase family protein [Ktedonobacterales bacterium]|nr:flavin reductase family protein [Ktedonobacterales bacterium]